MDRLIYTAMTGAKHIVEQQATVSNNLANATTTGFRAQLDTFRAVPVLGQGLPTRTFVVDSTVGTDFRAGAIQQTGRDLDVAIQGEGWLAVERADGTEGYTRHGSLKLNENGVLQTHSGLNVMGDGGPISIPPDVVVTIAKDGTISTVSTGTVPGATTVLGRIKLVNPPQDTLVRGDDGLFNVKNGDVAEADAGVSLLGGALEGSNVNVVDSMVNMINLARQFEMHMNLLKNAENNAAKADQFLALS
ncbi:flagellar basal-body rod protein FlgF [Noviherbaspirillum cavernae]|uniref:Flagellar basal-body rod protein FlgF n=1 Tax=Noviherbaspirillum cavernae TaxID=2320862 RepID=A0A418X0C6_9BURK|nr:flagellar basal-body rod protein FlgF [Noviherbaspirillum cavernae]RJG05938.1 flagellar basal-body rod protein FlgF [Noviherbaspirillum cavernae]